MKHEINDHDVIERFESGCVAADDFHHADHVRLAFAYLNCYSVLEALSKFSQALMGFAAASGKPDRYNETITYAYFFLIRERMARHHHQCWKEFASANADLLGWANGILARYYQEPTLKSDLARSVFIFPDKW